MGNSLILSQNLYIYLLISIFLLVTGIYGLIRHKSFIGILISLELILNGAAVNMMAVNTFLVEDSAAGQIFTFLILGIAVSEAIIFLGLIIVIYKHYSVTGPDDVSFLKKNI